MRAARALVMGAVIAAAAGPAHAEESARLVDRPRVVFDWSRDACAEHHYPDLPVRAYRDAEGRVQLLLPHYETRRMSGPRLSRLSVSCDVVFGSAHDPRPLRYDDRAWLAAVWTTDGRTLRALVHAEYLGSLHPGRCPGGGLFRCWQNAITSAVSRDGGRSFTRPAPPGHLVAAGPYRYRAGSGPAGVFAPSNIVRNPVDGRFYVMVQVERREAQPWGVCLLRTRRLADPHSWRAWDGSAFRVGFRDPYRTTLARRSVCRSVARDALQKVHESLTWNAYLERWVAVGVAHTGRGRGPGVRSGIYWSTSRNLITWTPRRLLMRAELPWTHQCGDRDPVLYPSLIDPRSRSRNFDVTGRTALLFYTRFNMRGCARGSDRDLLRRTVVFSRSSP